MKKKNSFEFVKKTDDKNEVACISIMIKLR